MLRYKALKDFGTWCKKGETGFVSNQRGLKLAREGVLEILEYGDKILKDMRLFKKYNLEYQNAYSRAKVKKLLLKLDELDFIIKAKELKEGTEVKDE